MKKGPSLPTRETHYVTCLLIHGPIPQGKTNERYHYREQVREWWRDQHTNCNPPIKEETLHRFWNRYLNWYNNERYKQRK